MPTRRESISMFACVEEDRVQQLTCGPLAGGFSSVRMLNEIHCTTSDLRPAISFHLVLAGIVTSRQD